jgi:hypothetical protein
MVGGDAGHDIAAGMVVKGVDGGVANRSLANRNLANRNLAMTMSVIVGVVRGPFHAMMTRAQRPIGDERERRRDRQTRCEPP